MCKSPNEPGGPYRCSADMRSRYQAASRTFETARYRAHEASLKDNEAQQEVRALSETLADPTLSDTQRNALTKRAAKAADKANMASKEAQTALSQFSGAATKWRSALADFDSTPQGLTDLHRDLYFAQETNEYATVTSLNERSVAAVTQMNKDSAERAARWGGEPSTYFLPPVGEDDAPAPLRDQVIGSAPTGKYLKVVATASAQARPGAGERTITYTFTPESGDPVKARVSVPDQEPAPSMGGMLTRMTQGAAEVTSQPNFVQFCHHNGYDRKDPAQVETARSRWDEGKHHDQQGRRIFGETTWDSVIRRTVPTP